MSESISHGRRLRWKALACGVAIAGTLGASVPVGAASPTVPGAPTAVSATPGVRSAKVSFAKPADNGGAKITGYRARCTSSDGGRTASHAASKSPIFVASLTPHKTYTCTVKARNRVGYGPASDPSNAFKPRADVPGAPTEVTATAGVRSVKVAFTKPADSGGSPIVNYRVRCVSSDGGKPGSHEGARSPIRVAGLSGAKTYTCTVKARNRVGVGPVSDPSNAVVTNA
jgi:hypothetical protein